MPKVFLRIGSEKKNPDSDYHNCHYVPNYSWFGIQLNKDYTEKERLRSREN